MSASESYPRRGHLYWVRIPDEPGSKRRPALVVSPDIRNRLANDVIVIPVSSVLREAPTHVRLRAREAGFARPSVAKCSRSRPSVVIAWQHVRSVGTWVLAGWSRSRRPSSARSGFP